MSLIYYFLASQSAVPTTGNPAVDQTLAGVERASLWTDRALMIGLLVIILLMCGYFLKMANEEVRRLHKLQSEERKTFLDAIDKMTLAQEKLTVDAIKQIASNTTISERVVRLIEKLEIRTDVNRSY